VAAGGAEGAGIEDQRAGAVAHVDMQAVGSQAAVTFISGRKGGRPGSLAPILILLGKSARQENAAGISLLV
jgi:hypothetical protein